SPGGAPSIEMLPTALSPLISGHPISATFSTPGTDRRCSSTWSQRSGDCGTLVTASTFKIRSDENPVGWFNNRSNEVTNNPADRWMTKQKATCAAINNAMMRPRERESSAPRKAADGLTADARKAGANPHKNATPHASTTANPRTRQSIDKLRLAECNPRLIIRT